MLICVLIPLIIFGVLLVKVDFKSIMIGIFWGIISVVLTLFIDLVILPKFISSSTVSLFISGEISIMTFVIYFITAALPEEISKFICIKFSGCKGMNDILINSILVAITFSCIENLIYFNKYDLNLLLMRLLQPGHLFFQLLMALLLIKGLNGNCFGRILFNILAIIVPMVCHTMFNAFNTIDDISNIFSFIGILTYVLTFYLIYKLPRIKNE